MLGELATLRRDPIAGGVGFPEGRGRPVFLIPGYMTGDPSLSRMAKALGAAGWEAETAGIRLNVGCASAMAKPLEKRLEAHVAACGGRKAVLLGQSRGGVFAKLLAARRPDLVEALITLGTPMLDPLAVHLLVLANVGVVGTLGTLGVPGVLKVSCTRAGGCCEDVRRDATARLPESVEFLSIYSRSDGIVDWRACLDPAARRVQVDSSHCGMAWNPEVWRVIGAQLARVGA